MKFSRKITCIFFSALFSFSLFSCSVSKLEKKILKIKTADGKEVTVKAEIAKNDEERQMGFMFRKNIPDGTGMLFIFENDQILNFWMKNTPTALSIAYITSDGRIRDILDMTPYSLASVKSSGYVRYALEVPQGWYKKAGIKAGDKLVIDFKD